MDRYSRLISRARAGESILIDGATGSECVRRGAPELKQGWSGGAALSNPDIVVQVHGEYIELGAELIASNTFSTGKNILRDAGVIADFEAYNRRGVELAIEARAAAGIEADGVVVAGGISNWSFSGSRPSLDELRQNTVEQATIMRDAGVDLFSLEMMVDIPQMTATLDAVSTLDVPVWVGFSIGPDEGHPLEALADPVPLRDGGHLADAVEVAASYPVVDVMAMMHTDVRLTARGVETIRENWAGPIAAYAHASKLQEELVTFDDVISPADYAAYETAWRSAGATILGGCCGIGPPHIRALANVLAAC